MSENTKYIEDIFDAWQRDRSSVDQAWSDYFAKLSSRPATGDDSPTRGAAISDKAYKQGRVDSLLWAYRDVGYRYAALNPLRRGKPGPGLSYLPDSDDEPEYEQLTPEEFGLSSGDLNTVFNSGRAMVPSAAPLRDILEAFRETYCSSIGVEFLHIQDKDMRHWLIETMESSRNRPTLDPEQKRIILQDLIRTEELERFLGTHFIGQKRFSLEGSESVVPGLHVVVDAAHKHGVEEIIIGTTHRGRLSILNTILNMSPEEIFSTFEEKRAPGQYGGSGDVKYHIGYSTDHVHEDGTSVRVSIAPNPSFLECVDGVVEGKARAVQDEKGDTERRRVLPLLVHGDAAFTGEGVVAEILNLARLDGYRTGGTIHLVINNQIGFTTPARSARSTLFPTDIAKMIHMPILHVNGDDPEAVFHAMTLAFELRQRFGSDVVVDVFCFRRHGHNEGDEPSFTHPQMYGIISEHPGVAALYGGLCARNRVMTSEDQEQFRRETVASLKASLEKERKSPGEAENSAGDGELAPPSDTGVPEKTLRNIAEKITAVPKGFSIHPKLARIVARRAEDIAANGAVDWSAGEALAFGSLLLEGTPIRLSGEDSSRGTFSQRHLVWWDSKTTKPSAYVPLNSLAPDSAIQPVDSPLSEYSILAFEYGYSLGRPSALVIWEAQFGDFAHGAQVVIDDFVSAGGSRWGHANGVVLFLPHGYEGQGPDHSSARLERFLQLCANDNIRVCNPTTPAQYFHMLRRQAINTPRRPLVVMTPKSLLRHRRVISTLGELSGGGFKPVLDDPAPPDPVNRLIVCSGKIYYDLLAHREEQEQPDTAMVRVEQLYPFPAKELDAALTKYSKANTVVWVQEEPSNQGARSFVLEQFSKRLPGHDLLVVSRPECASTATGFFKQHAEEQAALMERAFTAGKE